MDWDNVENLVVLGALIHRGIRGDLAFGGFCEGIETLYAAAEVQVAAEGV